MRDVMKFWLTVFVLGFLFVSAVGNAAECFTADTAAKYMAKIGGTLVYEAKSPAAVDVALRAMRDTKKADSVRVYISPNGAQMAFLFYVGSCVAREDGTPAYKDDQAMLYVVEASVGQAIIEIMKTAHRRSQI